MIRCVIDVMMLFGPNDASGVNVCEGRTRGLRKRGSHKAERADLSAELI